MHAFAEESYDWPALLCPLFIIVLAALAAGLLMRRFVPVLLRVIGFMIVVPVALWLLDMVPKVLGAREAAPLTQCRTNMKQIAKAVLEYHDQHGRLPTPSVAEADHPPTSWRVGLCSLIEVDQPSAVVAKYDGTRAWDDQVNLPVAQRQPVPYFCYSNKSKQDPDGRWYTAYAFVTGPGTAFPTAGPLTVKDITDGTSETMLLVEACGRKIVWTEPRDVDVSREQLQINAHGDEPGMSSGVLSSYHEAGAHCALADGSVRFLSEKISEDVLRALTTAAEEDEPGEF